MVCPVTKPTTWGTDNQQVCSDADCFQEIGKQMKATAMPPTSNLIQYLITGP